jgi:hypothetical protein
MSEKTVATEPDTQTATGTPIELFRTSLISNFKAYEDHYWLKRREINDRIERMRESMACWPGGGVEDAPFRKLMQKWMLDLEEMDGEYKVLGNMYRSYENGWDDGM